MVSVGEQAPAFTLPGTAGDDVDQYSLEEATAEGVAVLVFYPFDFSPVCTEELCEFRDVEWLTLTDDVDVFGISTDSAYAHQAFIERYDLTFPLLSDSAATVCEAYDIRYDLWEEHQDVSRRALFLVDAEGAVRYKWETDDALESPSLDDLHDAMMSTDVL